MNTKLIYIDDSGAESTGVALYGWIEVDITNWRFALRKWLDWRRTIYDRFEISMTYEFHAANFLGARNHASADPEWNKNLSGRLLVVEEALQLIRDLNCFQVGAAFRHTAVRGKDFHPEKVNTYLELVRHLDDRLTAKGELGIVVMDGDGSDAKYIASHRTLKLSTRSIIEDPMFQHSHRSQWVQMADLIAYVAYQHVHQRPSRAFAWNWYPDFLTSCDPNGGPIAI